ncbi:MAG: tRNA uridine-5-carboxymethylaminomethyl(34) synthesis GTPase MnmE [Synergistaceae bacterium]|nr:tRNA uridine-5-carboxymethylaminomethyl(34) synthesis GTPase MnmE [Synergistaceae bacterium]
MNEDTIAAVSTAWGESGIAIIRLSGPDSVLLADGLFKSRSTLAESPARSMRYGHILDPTGEFIDEVLAVRFKAPHSYTGEDMAEIHCHGGTMAARKTLEKLVELGARHAEPGEFTRRAFLNGRIDLAQAESVLGIIRARSDKALSSAARSLRGELSTSVRNLRERLLHLSAILEASFDFPEEDVPLPQMPEIVPDLERLRTEAESLFQRCRDGQILREGIRVAIVGCPNVGKSSLLNALLQESRAIVTAIPGTTRDVIEAVLTHRGVPIRLADTAGIRTPADLIEEAGIAQTLAAVKESDIKLWVLDGSRPFGPEDRLVEEQLQGERFLVLVNKTDLSQALDLDRFESLHPGIRCLLVSAKTGKGIDQLKEEIVRSVSSGGILEEACNASARQVEELRTASALLAEALQAGSLDLAANCLRDCRLALERFLGISADADLLDLIFSQFCLGK